MNVNGISQEALLNMLIQQLNKTSQSTATTGTEESSNSENVNFSDMIVTQLDTDGDGKISEEEAAQAMATAKELLGSLNTQKCSMREFQLQGAADTSAMNTELPQATFEQLDSDEDGVISPEEFTAYKQYVAQATTAADGANSPLTVVTGKIGANGEDSSYKSLMRQLLNHY